MTFGRAFAHAHREAIAFMLACPVIALIPILAELLQHWVEMGLGMYDGVDGAQAAEMAPERMQFGMVKVIALSVMTYPVVRYLAGGRDAGAARTLESRAVALFAVVLALQLGLAALDLFVLRAPPTVSLGLFAAMLLATPLLLRWIVAAPLGIFVSPARSIREMAPHFLWAFALIFAAMLPLMALHYALGVGAIFSPAALKWPLLMLDSVVVGLLSIVMVAANWFAASRAGEFKDDSRAFAA